MCGIGGIISKSELSKEQSLFFQDLMVSLQVRGRDAMGFVAYPNNLTPIKHADDVDSYLKDGKKTIWQKVTDSYIALGHTRQKTRGSQEFNYNNHPFSTKDFVLAHNGTIRNDDNIKEHFKINNKIDTDSYVIIRLIQHFYNKSKNIPSAIAEARDRLQGSYACWLLHKETGDVYLFKSSQADLAVAYLKPWDCFIFGSTIHNFKDLIQKIFDKSNEECGLFNTNIMIRKLDDDKIYKINLLSAKTKRNRTKIYSYIANPIDIPKKTVISKQSTFLENDLRLKEIEQRKIDRLNSRNKYRTDAKKESTGNEEMDSILLKLKNYGFESEIRDKIKLIIPNIKELKDVLVKNGITLGGSNNNRIKVKMHRPLLLLKKIETLAIQHCNILLPVNGVTYNCDDFANGIGGA